MTRLADIAAAGSGWDRRGSRLSMDGASVHRIALPVLAKLQRVRGRGVCACMARARGSVMAAKRILRCNPWHEGGVDPVP